MFISFLYQQHASLHACSKSLQEAYEQELHSGLAAQWPAVKLCSPPTQSDRLQSGALSGVRMTLAHTLLALP